MNDVLVSGGTGFVASHCILQLLGAGRSVRATVRAHHREADLRATIRAAGGDDATLQVVVADLTADDGWAEAVRGCAHVLHVASPFPAEAPAHADELIIPARDGALRVLRAARNAGVTRVVMTSSFAAVGYGIPQPDRPFDERDWTDPDEPTVQAYMQSKYHAERAAWDFVDRHGGGLELTVINPTGIFGPALSSDFSTSIGLVRSLIEGALPAVPRLSFGVVDVRDVADLHLRAMTQPEAAHQRFIAVAGKALTFLEVAKILKANLGRRASRVPDMEMADAEVRALAATSPAMAAMVPQLGIVREASADKAIGLLGWQPRSAEEAILASAESLFRLGVVA